MLDSAAGLLPALGALGPVGLGVGAALAIAGALMLRRALCAGPARRLRRR